MNGHRPGVIRPRHAGLRIGIHRPVFYHGRRRGRLRAPYGFGFFTPVAVPYPSIRLRSTRRPSSLTLAIRARLLRARRLRHAWTRVLRRLCEQPRSTASPLRLRGAAARRHGADEPSIVTPEEQPEGEVAPHQVASRPSPPPGSKPLLSRPSSSKWPRACPCSPWRLMSRRPAVPATGPADERNIDAWLGNAVARFASRNYEPAAMAVRRAIRAFRMPSTHPWISAALRPPGDFDRQAPRSRTTFARNPMTATLGSCWALSGISAVTRTGHPHLRSRPTSLRPRPRPRRSVPQGQVAFRNRT